MQKIRACFVLAALLCSRELVACAPAPHAGERIAIVEESAVIIWEPSTKTQHFIRRATFQGEAKDFGFLVPTPTAPTLARVDDDIFDHLVRKTSRQTVYRTETVNDFTPLILMPFLLTRLKNAETTGNSAPVEVLSTQKVAGYEAAILDATDAAALNKWLADNGYATTPDLTEWLEAYIAQRWIISAFKIDKASEFEARTSAVRMTFTTDRPFFPYREPASQRTIDTSTRALRIWFLGPERVKGAIGNDGNPWPGEVQWSDEARDLEAGGVKLPAGTRLSYFEDRSNPRPGTDELVFQRDPDQGTIVPPPYEVPRYETRHIPLDVVIAPVLLVGWYFKRKTRRDKRPTAPRDGSPDPRIDA